ncbi:MULTISPECIES: rhamnulokinase [unclassified Arthrobacter]|uniref:rhamnulokinase n=1 Tax=unclassified Arthrobacter TaxID=235627 RepID=UPI0014913413|nr:MULTISPECIES: rhamnulokinase family protein [unclassified Arthrobacter]MBE0010384.1 rhamnulokinase [Arthrobacter sp. AET 35A]NOJ64293.1 rhamnulokinase [Arthrobacter sp. 147(2020)]
MIDDARPVFVAVDIGASSGRVILGQVGTDGPRLQLVHRFPNGAVEVDGTLRWDVHSLFEQVLAGLTLASGALEPGERIASIGVDTWAVDYGLIDDDGALATLPYSHRDGRGETAVAAVHQLMDFDRLYSTTGVQFLPFNTLYQLASEASLEGVQALLIPDLLCFWLTGRRASEATNASTTGLTDARTGGWDPGILARLGIPASLFPAQIEPGQTLGMLLPGISRQTGLPPNTAVVAVGSHDTASAVAAVPALAEGFAYISSGTWSLVGVELAQPVLSPASRTANFTNERGIDGTVRYLRNVGGLWLLQECLRSWTDAGDSHDLAALLAEAASLPAGGPLIDADSPEFIPPGNMPRRIRDAAHRAGGVAPAGPAGVVRCILESLAAAYARTVRQAVDLSGTEVDVVHIVGGGSQNTLLCQLTADATGLPVVAGPVEATALGNVMVQARAAGLLGETASLADIRAAVARTADTTRYTPYGEGGVQDAVTEPARRRHLLPELRSP